MNNHTLAQSIVGGLFAIVLTVLGFMLSSMSDRIDEDHDTIIRMETRLETLAADKDIDASQTDQLKRLWQIMSKIKTGLNEVRIKDGLPSVDTSSSD